MQGSKIYLCPMRAIQFLVLRSFITSKLRILNKETIALRPPFCCPIVRIFATISSMPNPQEILDLFRRSGALLEGHFILRSGLRSPVFFQCARLCENMGFVTEIITHLRSQIDPDSVDTVIAPAMGALVLGQEMARQLGKRFIFPEKVNDELVLRRGFIIHPGERFLVVEDVVTQGGRVRETIHIVQAAGGQVNGVAVLVDRSEGKARQAIGMPLYALLEMSFPTYDPNNLPEDLKAIPAIKPGS